MAKTEAPKRKHRATYAADKRTGGYLIRVSGPFADRFIDKEVPVTLKNGTEHAEKLTRVVWSGVDKESGEKVTLYRFEPRPRENEEPVEF